MRENKEKAIKSNANTKQKGDTVTRTQSTTVGSAPEWGRPESNQLGTVMTNKQNYITTNKPQPIITTKLTRIIFMGCNRHNLQKGKEINTKSN